jgi:sugar/nucleoside kinase (ribokinase family)
VIRVQDTPAEVPGRPAGRVLSLGSINADFQVRVERRPEVSETLVARDFRGCLADDGASVFHVGAWPVEVTDTTGAGDAFAGALAAALAGGQGWETAVRWAVAASHLAVQGYGSHPSYPGREALEALARELPIHRDAG